MRALVALFAKTPEAGRVKTRLSPPLSEAEALELHRALILESLGLIRRAAAEVGASCELSFSGAPDPTMRETLGDVRISTQSAGDLGARMSSFFAARLSEGFGSVVLIGSDSPTQPWEHIAGAVRALEDGSHEVVVGPSLDGGYYLVGMSRHVPQAFAGIDWGTERVFGQTRNALSQLDIEPFLLPTWFDVDRESDLRRLIGESRTKDARVTEPLRSLLDRLDRAHWPSG